jgi:hypothetical protein
MRYIVAEERADIYVEKECFLDLDHPGGEAQVDFGYLISYAKIQKNVSLAFFKGYIGIGFVLDFKNDIVLDCCSTLITDEAKDFMKSIFIGRNFHSMKDVDEINKVLEFSFHGPPQKSLHKIVKSNYNKFNGWKQKNRKLVNNYII